MGHGVGEQQHVAGAQVHLAHAEGVAGALPLVGGGGDGLAFHLQPRVYLGVLVAAGHQYRGAVAGTDVVQRHDHVDLAHHPGAGVVLAEGHVAERHVAP